MESSSIWTSHLASQRLTILPHYAGNSLRLLHFTLNIYHQHDVIDANFLILYTALMKGALPIAEQYACAQQ